MPYRSSIAAVVLSSALCLTVGGARAWDDANYPNLKGQWVRVGPAGFNGTRFDPSKPPGRGQEAPLTPEYQVIFEANLVDQAAGGQGTTPTYACLSPGMPRATNGYNEIEFVVTPDTTLHSGAAHQRRSPHLHRRARLAREGWSRPSWATRSANGSIRKGAGRYDTARGRDPRSSRARALSTAAALPLHKDNQTIVKERIYLDKADPNVFHDEVTVIDHALTRPWTVTKTYGREPGKAQPLLDRDDTAPRTTSTSSSARRAIC